MNSLLHLVTGATNDGGEDGARCVIAGEPSLHQAGAVITHQGGSLFVVAHGVSSATHTGARTHTPAVTRLDPIMEFPVCLDCMVEAISPSRARQTTHIRSCFVDKQ